MLKVIVNSAKYLGLTVTGTLGILLKAKRKGIVSRVDVLLTGEVI